MVVREAELVAREAVDTAVDIWNKSGLSAAFSSLATLVWSRNQDRHEPELGDDSTTLGTLCARNLSNLIEREMCGTGGEGGGVKEPSGSGQLECGWGTPGLVFSKPHGALQLTLSGRHFFVMKAPLAAGRTLGWDSMVNWDGESDTRQRIAQTNSEELGSYFTPASGQGTIWSHLSDKPASALREFLVVWAGEPGRSQTAGWMTLPGIGDAPFIAKSTLWFDEAEASGVAGTTSVAPQGPNFDKRPTPAPIIKIKMRPSDEGQG